MMVMDISAKEAMESHISISARTSIESDLNDAPEKLLSTATPLSPPRSSRKGSHESVTTHLRQTQSNASTPLRLIRKFPATPSTRASLDDRRVSHSGADDIHREKTPASLLTLSDYNGSEDSHTERRFLRQYEELESRCSGILLPRGVVDIEPFPEFITPWFLRRLNYGPCKAGDIVDLLRFLRPKGHWISPFHISILDPYLAASLEKAIYPNQDTFNASQKALLNSLHHFVFSAYSYAQGIFFPFDGEWEADRREQQVDALNLYVEDIIALVEYIRNGGRVTSLREFVKDRTKAVHRADSRRTFLFAEGGDTKTETEEYVFNIFLAVLGLWTVGSQISNDADVDFSKVRELRLRYDYSKNLPYRISVMENVSLIRETFGVLVTPLDGSAGGMEWVRPLLDFDASTISQRPFRFVLTRDVSRHMALDHHKRLINIFCEEAVGIEDSLARLEGHIIAK